LDEVNQAPPSRKSAGNVNSSYTKNPQNLISGGKSARLKQLKKVEHVVISLADTNNARITQPRSNAIASPLGLMEGTHY